MSVDVALQTGDGEVRQNVRRDRRVSRTRRALASALHELTKEKRYEDVTVQEIIDRADVSRSTFYAHFIDKQDLLVELYRTLREGHALDGQPTRNAPRIPFGWSRDVLEWAADLLREYQSADRLYHWVSDSEGCVLAVQELESELRLLARTDLARLGRMPSRSVPDYVVEFVASSFMSMLVRWLENDAVEPLDEIDKRFRSLALPGAAAAVGAALGSDGAVQPAAIRQ